MITATGYTPEQAEALTLPRLLPLLDYWSERPPAHETLHGLLRIVATYCGVDLDPGRGAAPDGPVSDDLADLFPELDSSGLLVTEE